MLSIIFPIRDEEKNLPKIIKLFNENNFEFKYEIIFVNDFSQDSSFEVMTNMALKNTSIIAVNNLRKGIGGAINIGIQ